MSFFSSLLSYAVGISFSAIALLIKLWLEPLFSRSLGSIFYIAVLLSAWYGGFRVGLVTIFLSALVIDYFILPPKNQPWLSHPKDLFELITFIIIALIINLLTSNFQQSKQKIKKLNQQLTQENSWQLQMALSAAHMAIWDWDVVTGDIKWSPEHERLFGIAIGSFDGKFDTFAACLHPEDRHQVTQALQQTLHNQTPYQSEYRIIWPDGSIHWIESRGQAFCDAAGKLWRVIGTIMAIDDRKQVQNLLQQQFEQQRLVMEMTQKIRQSLNLPEILQTTVDEVRQFLKCDRAIVFQFSPDMSGTVVVESVSPNFTAILSTNIKDPCLSGNYTALFQAGLVTAKTDIYSPKINQCHLDLLENFQVRANLVVPILNKDELWGLLIAHHCLEPREWQSSEIILLQQLASQVSIAIQQSTLFQQLQTELSERKQIEIALRQSEQRYRSLVNASAQIVWLTDADGMTIIASEKWEELTGQTPTEKLGWGWLNCVHPEDRDRTFAAWQESYQNRTFYETEYRLRMKDGNYRYFFARGVPILDADGEISEWIGTCTDITERKLSEATLRENQIQLQRQLAEIENIYQSAPIGLNVLDTDLRFVRINQRLAEINGFSVEEHIGRTVRELLPDLADTSDQLLRPILETGKPLLNVEISGTTPAQPGVKRTWLESFLPLKNGDAIIGISTVCEEITERKQAEAELKQAKEELEIRVAERTAQLRKINANLQQSESILRSFFNSSAMLMGIVELHNNDILHISDNLAAAQFFGTTPEAMQNKFASDLGVPQIIIQQWVNHYYQAQQIQAPLRFEYPHETTKGQRWLSASVCPIAISANGYPRFSYIVEDITEREQAKEHIEASLREKEVLLKEIHHRVKNNLAIVSSLIQMQSRRTQDAQANEILRDSHNRIASIALVHETLYSSKDLANIDFSQYISKLTTHLFDSYNTKYQQIEIKTQIEDVILDIEIAVPCGLIINELISNALKYAFPDERNGKIKVKFYQENEHDLILLIQDNGIGLPENFDSQKSKTLGINLVRGLVQQLRGSMTINCQQGTEFRIFLRNLRHF
ncbi:PAS domain-containing protein [Nostoc sp. FACHB-110]|uniref:PAS domain-containing protein n=1 Tax=Nostoc sp. FACHB-110 TaxID=2692834 RepID=UPI001687D941|nr:PAS domain-containing protein [Nostoc sp. FACHB-110]MBD2435436.1 PAS domain-containing protein [Nostoc sp. FACHB-110]